MIKVLMGDNKIAFSELKKNMNWIAFSNKETLTIKVQEVNLPISMNPTSTLNKKPLKNLCQFSLLEIIFGSGMK